MTSLLPGLFLGLAISATLGWRHALVHWRLSLRREALLLALLFAREQYGGNGQTALAVSVAERALAVEMGRQSHVRARFWTRVPRLGEPWPGQELPPEIARLHE